MATASPLDPTFGHDAEIDAAVEKLRAEQPLTDRERALVRARGLELAGCTGRLTVIDDADNQAVEVDPEEEQELLEAIVESEADLRDGRYVTAEKFFADRGIPYPPAPRAG